jgi:hypothetical protein
MDVQKEVIVIKVFNTSACQGHLESLIELAVKMKVVQTAPLVTIAWVELKTSNYSHAPEEVTAQLRLEYLQNVLQVLIMMNFLENLRQTANSALWEESAVRLQEIKVSLAKRVISVLLAPIQNSGLVHPALSVVTDQD